MVIFLYSAYFGSYFCYHSNGKSQINTRLLHLGYCSNKLIGRNYIGSTLFSKRINPVSTKRENQGLFCNKIWFNQINPMTLGAAKLNILKKIFQECYKSTGPRSAVGNVSGNRCESDCRSRGREFNPGPVPYFRGD